MKSDHTSQLLFQGGPLSKYLLELSLLRADTTRLVWANPGHGKRFKDDSEDQIKSLAPIYRLRPEIVGIFYHVLFVAFKSILVSGTNYSYRSL